MSAATSGDFSFALIPQIAVLIRATGYTTAE
jgi:hypothetical protein